MIFSKKFASTVAVSSLQSFSLAQSVADPSALTVKLGATRATTLQQEFDVIDARQIEASHLAIHAACKWGKASFSPTEEHSKGYTAAISNLYSQMKAA